MKNLDIKKTSELSEDSLNPLLTKAINKSIAQNVFPEKAETASVIPLDKVNPTTAKC